MPFVVKNWEKVWYENRPISSEKYPGDFFYKWHLCYEDDIDHEGVSDWESDWETYDHTTDDEAT
jgi:hypothetical protein